MIVVVLTSVTIPGGVTSIGFNAFVDCNNIQELYIDDVTSYLSISYGDSLACPLCETEQNVSLYVNGKLATDIVILDSVTEIPSYAFNRVTNITSVTIPSSVTSIGSQAFYNCTSLESVIFGENSQLTSIKSSAFYNCDSLTSITIPDSVTSIGSYAFYNCSNLVIYFEAEDESNITLNSNWNYSNCPVYWAGEWEMVDGVPVPIESGVESLGLSDVGEDFGIGFDGLGFREEIYFNDKRERKVV